MSATGAGPAIGERVTALHPESGSVVHGTVRIRPGFGLVIDDGHGCLVDMDRDGWVIQQADIEPPDESVVVIDCGEFPGPICAQRVTGQWWIAGTAQPRTWEQIKAYGPIEVVWEPSC